MSGREDDLANWLRDERQSPCEHAYYSSLDPACCSPCLRDRLLASPWLADFADRVRADERRRLGMTEKHDGPHACFGCGLTRAVAPLAEMSRRMRENAALRTTGRTTTP